ncbi:MAG: FxLYD domain-containing protein [Synergistaceae bacterium]|nr:FxLYD domain-containing protein [Synergistaceae bacterium]
MAANKRYLLAAALGVFFGTGFLCGFFSGYRYAAYNFVCELPAIIREDEASGGATLLDASGDAASEGEVAELVEIDTRDIGLVLEDYWMDSDDNGLFIAGAIHNADTGAFDSVRVAFDLLDSRENAYSAVTARNDERIEPGDTWDFTIYIPYGEMDKFNSFRFQSVMGVKR